METGICNIAYLPLRKDPKDSSEMVSQVVFGETFDIQRHEGSWSFIKNHFDNYTGWVSTKMIKILSEYDIKQHYALKPMVLAKPINYLKHTQAEKSLLLPSGCIVYPKTPNIVVLCDDEYQYEYAKEENNSIAESIIKTAVNLLNTPYLWGGRTSYGIDCSGLVQLCFRHAGISLLRDANQQATQGTEVSSVNTSQKTDVAFFENAEKRIVHTGILMGNGFIVHASGKVRIDKIDDKGIYNEEIKDYTHQLCSIKRML